MSIVPVPARIMEDGIGKMEWPTATGDTETPWSPGDKPTPVRTKVARIETLHRAMEAAGGSRKLHQAKIKKFFSAVGGDRDKKVLNKTRQHTSLPFKGRCSSGASLGAQRLAGTKTITSGKPVSPARVGREKLRTN